MSQTHMAHSIITKPLTRSTQDSVDSTAPEETQVGIPAFLNIFQSAAAYGDLLDEESDSEGEGSSDEVPTPPLTVGSTAKTSADDITTTTATTTKEKDAKEVNDLLTSTTSRLAQLAVNTYSTASAGLDGSGGKGPATHIQLPESACEITAKAKQENDRVIPLLIQEFGQMAEEGEEERLLAILDAAYFAQVAILGLVHCTTHRVTFHASLLQTRQNDHPAAQIIKSGPVTIHTEGLTRNLKHKKRVWFELSHDMLSTFPDSTDEGRTRPLRTLLLAALTDVKPMSMADPRSIHIAFDTAWGAKASHLEFDTAESAGAWSREINGALHAYRIRRQTLMDPSYQQSEQHGVRWSIPLHRIVSLDSRTWASFATVISFRLAHEDFVEDNSASATPTPWIRRDTVEPDLVTQTYAEEAVGPHQPPTTSTPTTLTLTIIQGFYPERFHRAIEVAKQRRRETPTTLDHGDEITVDFGDLAFAEKVEVHKAEDGVTTMKGKEDITTCLRAVFGLAKDEELWYKKSSIVKMTRQAGYLVVTPRFVCFWSKGLLSDTRIRFSIHDVNLALVPEDKSKCVKHVLRLTVQIKGQKDVHLTFRHDDDRVEAMTRINSSATLAREKRARHDTSSSISSTAASSNTNSYFDTPSVKSPVSSTTPLGILTPSNNRPVESPQPTLLSPSSFTEELAPVSDILERARSRAIPASLLTHMPKAINIPVGEHYHIKPQHFACLTIGSRGDVQPYIALALGLQKERHKVTIVTHEEYKGWIEGFGIMHRTAGGDPGALMKLSVDHKIFSPQFFKESLGHFRKWLDDLLLDAYTQIKGSEATVLIESPSAMAGLHIAEALNIPYFRAFTMPWSRTVEYPHAFISPPDFVAGSFNYSTYVIFDNVFWRALAPQINRWRKNTLGLHSTDLDKMAQQKIPFLYNFSPHVVPKPLDWADTTIITGYWFLDNPDPDWAAPKALLDFMAKARADGKPLVYIGFGSIVVEDPKAMTRHIVKGVLKSDVRAILNKGWSARMASAEDDEPEVELPEEVYSVDKIPHDWLFPQIDAAMHHGGAGTTGASLRAGLPTLIKPWFGDQFFWASRVQKLGAGLRVANLNSSEIASALTKATTSRIMKEKAQAVGEKIRAENGVNLAIQELYLNLDRAGTRHPPPMKKRHSLGRAGKRLSSTLIDRKQLPDVTETEDVPPTCDLAAADSEARVRAKSPIHA